MQQLLQTNLSNIESGLQAPLTIPALHACTMAALAENTLSTQLLLEKQLTQNNAITMALVQSVLSMMHQSNLVFRHLPAYIHGCQCLYFHAHSSVFLTVLACISSVLPTWELNFPLIAKRSRVACVLWLVRQWRLMVRRQSWHEKLHSPVRCHTRSKSEYYSYEVSVCWYGVSIWL